MPETTNMIEEDDKFDDANNCRGADESEEMEMEMEISRIATIDVQERERFNSLVKNSTIIRRSYNTTRYITLTHSFTHLFTHSFTYLLTHSLTYSLTYIQFGLC